MSHQLYDVRHRFQPNSEKALIQVKTPARALKISRCQQLKRCYNEARSLLNSTLKHCSRLASQLSFFSHSTPVLRPYAKTYRTKESWRLKSSRRYWRSVAVSMHRTCVILSHESPLLSHTARNESHVSLIHRSRRGSRPRPTSQHLLLKLSHASSTGLTLTGEQSP